MTQVLVICARSADRCDRRSARADRSGGGGVGSLSGLDRRRRQVVGVGGPSDHRHGLTIFLLVRTGHRPAAEDAEPQDATAVHHAAASWAPSPARYRQRLLPHLQRTGRGHRRCGARHAGRCRGAAASASRQQRKGPAGARSSKTSWPSAADSWSRSSSASSERALYGREVRRDHRRRRVRPARRWRAG